MGPCAKLPLKKNLAIKLKRRHFGEWESNSNEYELGSFVGRECGISKESEFGSNLNFHGGLGEDTTVEEMEVSLRREERKPCAVVVDRSNDVDVQHFSGLQNDCHINEAIDDLGGGEGCINEVVDEVEGLLTNYNVAFNEVGGQRQTLIEVKNLFVDIGPIEGDWAQFQTLEMGVFSWKWPNP